MATPTENLSVLLSREELAFLLYLLKTDFIPGLDPDPLGDAGKEQNTLALAHAERALRARDLIMVDQKGELEVRETLLLMIGTCAYPELMISLHHFPTNAAPNRTFWNLRSGVIVAHNRPEAPLHSFSMVKGRDLLRQQIVDSCKLMTGEKPDLPEITTTNQVLKVVRETSAKDLPGAIQKLTSNGTDKRAAKELCATLAGQHAVSALHLAAQRADQPSLQEAATVLSGQTSTWLMTSREQPDQVSLKVVNQADIFDLLMHWTDMVENWPEISDVS